MLVILALMAPTASAGNEADEAEVNFRLAGEAFSEGDYRSALSHFMVSNRLSPNRSVTYNIGLTYEALEEYAEAYRWHQSAYRISREARDDKLMSDVQVALDRLAPRVARFSVTTDPPGATVYVDRRDLGAVGVTPLEIAVSPGSYTLVFEREGFKSVETDTFELAQQGDIRDVSVELAPIVGFVKVRGSEGSTVHVGSEDAESACTIPCEVALSEGTQILYFRKPGFRSLPSLVEVVRDETIAVTAELLPITGTVLVDADEAGALIEIDGEAAGYTPAVLTDIQIGDHDIRVSRLGFADYEQTVTVVEGDKLDLGVVRLDPVFTVNAASRAAQDVSDAPASVTLITGDEIRAFGYQTVAEAVSGVRGFYVTHDLAYSALGVRGFGRADDYTNRVLLTLDGHTLNETMTGGSVTDLPLLADLSDVRQIEVVRGPGSALYGSNAVFGVVNIVTRDGLDKRNSHVRLSNRTNHLIGRGHASLGDETVGGWVSLQGHFGNGSEYYFDEYADDPRTGGVSSGADRSTSASVSARAWAGDVEIQGFVTDHKQQNPTGSFGSLLADPRSRQDERRAFVEARYQHRFGNTDVNARVYYDSFVYNSVFPYGRYSNFVERYYNAFYGVEPRVIQHLGERARVTVGMEAKHNPILNFKADEHELLIDEPVGENIPFLNQPMTSIAAFGVVDLTPLPVLRLNLGVRYDIFDTSLEDYQVLNPRFAAILTPGNDVIKLLGGTAFRAPSVYESSYNDGGISVLPADPLVPERIATTELEWTHSFDEVLTLTNGAYYNRITSLIDTVPEQDVFKFTNLDGRVDAAGFESELRRTWKGGWMFAAQGALQRARRENLIDGEPLVNSPPATGSLMLAIPLGGGVTLAQKVLTGAPRLTNAGATTPWIVNWDATLTGRVVRPNVEYALGVRNLLDWRIQHPGSLDVFVDTLPQPGRWFYGSVTLAL